MTRKDIDLIAEAYASGLPRAYFSDTRGSVADKLNKVSNTASKEQMAAMLAKHPEANNPLQMGIALGDKIVDKGSIRIGRVDFASNDPNDFSDVYIDYAEFNDGTELNEQELEQLAADYPELVDELARQSLQ